MASMHLRRRLFAITLSVAVMGGCQAILGLDDPTIDPGADGAASPDGGEDKLIVEGPKIDSGASDGNADADGEVDADEPDVFVTYNEDWDNSQLWNYVDLKQLNVGTGSFVGAVFDGQYIYFAPSNNTLDPTFAARYDTKAGGLTAVQAWQFFDTATLHPDARGFEGTFFDGRYVYMVPFFGVSEHSGRVARFDTKSGFAFNNPNGWSHFDTTSINQYAKGFLGGSYDNKRYAFMTPGPGTFDGVGRTQAIAAKRDTTQASLDAGWELFDTQLIAQLDGGGPRGFCGTVVAGNYLYFVPFGYAGQERGRVVRYNQTLPFSSPSSWEVFDLADVDVNAQGFQGGGYDGRYVYFAPLQNPTQGHHGNVARFDTQQSFTTATSWNVFNLETLDSGIVPSQQDAAASIERVGYVGTGFDGRYLYLVPNNGLNGIHGWIARFDTKKAALNDPSAWSFYDASRITPNARGFCGSVFDGLFMYFIPCFTQNLGSTLVLRFYAANPAKMPKFLPYGSFL